MKKLMFAAVAAAMSGAVFAEPEVTSQIVGFVTPAQAAKTSMYAPVLQNISAQKLSIQDVKPIRSGEDKYVGGGALQLQTIDEGGASLETYTYWEEGELNLEPLSKAGWYANSGTYEAPDDYFFGFGEGMMLTIPDDWSDVALQMAGQVDDSSTVVPLLAKTSIFGNTRPLTLDIQAIVPSRTGDDKVVGSGMIQLQTVDEGGASLETYTYWEEGELNLEPLSQAGWYANSGTYETPDAYTFKLGEAMILTVPDDWTDVIFTLPPVVEK